MKEMYKETKGADLRVHAIVDYFQNEKSEKVIWISPSGYSHMKFEVATEKGEQIRYYYTYTHYQEVESIVEVEEQRFAQKVHRGPLKGYNPEGLVPIDHKAEFEKNRKYEQVSILFLSAITLFGIVKYLIPYIFTMTSSFGSDAAITSSIALVSSGTVILMGILIWLFKASKQCVYE